MWTRGHQPLILLTEDEAIIAVELQESLRDAGFSVAGPFATCAEAEAWLKTGTPDAAILDHALKDGPCDALAADLAAGRANPIFTGHDAPREMLAEFHAATWITKPVAFPRLLSALRRQIGAQA